MAAYDPTDLMGNIEAGKVVLLSAETWEMIKKVIRMSKPLPGPGMLARQKDDGVEIYPGQPGANGPYNFQIYTGAGSTVDVTTISVVDGTFGGMTPTLGGTPINAVPPPELDADYGDDIYLEISITPLASNNGTEEAPFWEIQGGQLTAVAIIAGDGDEAPSGTDASVDPDTGDITDGTYYRRIGTWNGQVLPTQPINTSLDFSLCAGGIDGGGNSVGILTVGVSSS